jgi:hypothetical protein
MTGQDPSRKDDQKSIKERLQDSFEAFKKNEKVDEIYQYATTNTRDTIAYILMATGLLLMLVNFSWAGSALVGVIFGFYFSNELGDIVRNYNAYIHHLGPIRSIILGGLLVAFLIAAPFVFVGAAVAVALRQLLGHHD